jgi:hypothetical protein
MIESRRLLLKPDETHWRQDETSTILGGVTVWDGTGTTEAHTASVCRIAPSSPRRSTSQKTREQRPKKFQGLCPHTLGLLWSPFSLPPDVVGARFVGWGMGEIRAESGDRDAPKSVPA